jgi:hypothetical protein
MSVFVYSPLLLLAPFSFRGFLRRHRAEALTVLAATASSLMFYASYKLWTGLWSAPGPRYLFTSMVLLMLPFGAWLDTARSPAARASVALLAGAGACVGLLTATIAWGDLITAERWETWEPPFGFLFELSSSPLAAALRAVGNPDLLDLFVIRLAQGWPGFPPAPGAALWVAGVWALGTACLATFLGRALAAAEPRAPDSAADEERAPA